MIKNWIEYFDEPEEQIILIIGFISGWKKLKPKNLPDSVRESCKTLHGRYLVGFYIARILQGVTVLVMTKVGGLF